MFLALFVVMAMICYFTQLVCCHAVAFLKTLTGLRYSGRTRTAFTTPDSPAFAQSSRGQYFQRLAVEMGAEVRRGRLTVKIDQQFDLPASTQTVSFHLYLPETA